MSVPVRLGQVNVVHPFVVVKSLIAGVILGIDFLQQHRLVLDFAYSPIKVLPNCPESANCVPPEMQGIVKEAAKARGELGIIMAIGESPVDVVNDCAIPLTKAAPYELPSCSSSELAPMMKVFKELFRATPGTTTVTQHFSPTSGPPVKIPPRQILKSLLHIRAELASLRRDLMEKGREIRKQKIDTRGSHIVYFAMSHMRNGQDVIAVYW